MLLDHYPLPLHSIPFFLCLICELAYLDLFLMARWTSDRDKAGLLYA